MEPNLAHILGNRLDTYKPSPNAVALTALVGLVLVLVLKDFFMLLAAGLAISALTFAWLLSLRLSIYEEGISYRSLFRSREMRWDEIDRFYFKASKRSVYFVPVGTYYSYKLVDSRRRKLSFGNRFEKPEEIGKQLTRLTYGPLFSKAADQFDNNMELDFGQIKVSRQGGLKVKKWFRWKQIPWDQLADYRIDKGTFYIWPVGKKYTTGPELGEIPNAFVLQGLLDTIFNRETS